MRTAREEESGWRSTAGINPLLLFNRVLARARKSDVRDRWPHGELNAVTTDAKQTMQGERNRDIEEMELMLVMKSEVPMVGWSGIVRCGHVPG